MHTAALIFPHQLFENQPVLSSDPEKILLVHHSLFYGDAQYPMRFHSKKIAFHQATMAAFHSTLKKSGHTCEHVDYQGGECELDGVLEQLASEGINHVCCVEPCDYTLEKRLQAATSANGLSLEFLPSPGFLNGTDENHQWRQTKKRWHMADFYKWQRVRLNILMEGDLPQGGKWSYDEDNRKKLPIKHLQILPAMPSVDYPTTHAQAKRWLDEFLTTRFELFGPYEDAMEPGQNWLYHSVLTPMLNVGLLTPKYIVDRALKHADEFNVPLNSVEGFIRQVVGWREFMRATYIDLGVEMRNGNHWQHTRSMPSCFYTATTGIDPVDDCISRVIDHGYCHHIERLMVLGGFMFLCEIHPNAIYKWFMEMFVDSYDWVMVPNVYAMSQHADGGLITTKPYFSGSNYILKMSHYKKGEWSETWDALFWRWIMKNQKELSGNHRWAMMCKNADRMDSAKKKQHMKTAEAFLDMLD